MDKKCAVCGETKGLKRGWTNCWYCSEECEVKHVSGVHATMPGGGLPYKNWVPHHIAKEISSRWEDS